MARSIPNGLMLFILFMTSTPATLNAKAFVISEMPAAAQEVLRGFSTAEIGADVKRIRQYLHPLFLAGEQNSEPNMAKDYANLQKHQVLPEQIEFGNAELFSDADIRIFFVPYVWIQKGFPEDIRMGKLYLIVSSDAGRTWKIVGSDCSIDKELVKKLAPGYKGKPSLDEVRKTASELARKR